MKLHNATVYFHHLHLYRDRKIVKLTQIIKHFFNTLSSCYTLSDKIMSDLFFVGQNHSSDIVFVTSVTLMSDIFLSDKIYRAIILNYLITKRKEKKKVRLKIKLHTIQFKTTNYPIIYFIYN